MLKIYIKRFIFALFAAYIVASKMLQSQSRIDEYDGLYDVEFDWYDRRWSTAHV